jgi:hypothetical protein
MHFHHIALNHVNAESWSALKHLIKILVSPFRAESWS